MPPGFTVLRFDRTNGRGGGAAIFIRSDLHFSVIKSPVDIESVWCKVYLGNDSVHIGTVYRRPE